MEVDKDLTLELCNILENHNRTGIPVLKATVGKWTERRALQLVIQSCREMIDFLITMKIKAEYKLVLLNDKDERVVKRLLDIQYDMSVDEEDDYFFIRVSSHHRLDRKFPTRNEAEEYMVQLAEKVNEFEKQLTGFKF